MFEIAGPNGEIRIKGIMTGFYITMTPKGRIVGQPLPEVNGTVWVSAVKVLTLVRAKTTLMT